MSDEQPADIAVEEAPIQAEESQEIVESAGDESVVESDSASDDIELSAEEAAEVEGVIEEALEAGASKEEVNEMIEEFVLKVNGKEVTKTLDWNDKESIKRELQKAAAFGQSSQENSEIKRLLKDLTGGLKNDPWAILKELGMDPDELAEARIRNNIEEMKKSPEQLDREKIQKELEDMRQKNRDYEEKAKTAELSKMQEEATVQLNSEIKEVIDAHPHLSATEMTLRRFADTMVYAMDNGFEDVKAKDVADIVEREMKEDIKKLLEAMPVKFLEEYISKNTLDAYQKSKLEEIKKEKPKTLSDIKRDVAEAAPKKPGAKKKYKSIDQLMRSR